MKAILFTDKSAQDLYADYMYKVTHALAGTDKEFRNMVLVDVHNYIQEGLAVDMEELEWVKIQRILEQLGDPYVYLRQVALDNKLNKALKSYNLPQILIQLFRLAKSSIKYSIYFMLYLFIFSLAIVFLAKLIFPDQTGLFVQEGGGMMFGFLKDREGATEVLNTWFYPCVLLISLIAYLLLTTFIKASRSHTNGRFILKG